MERHRLRVSFSMLGIDDYDYDLRSNLLHSLIDSSYNRVLGFPTSGSILSFSFRCTGCQCMRYCP